jgi:hypothetical protein
MRSRARTALAAVVLAAAVGGVPAAASAGPDQARLAAVKARGDAAIASRLTTLAADAGLIRSAVHLGPGDRSALSGLVSGQQSGLLALRSTIDGDTTVAQAVADVESIVTSYRVYALVDPKVHLVIAADRGAAAAVGLTGVETSLRQAIAAEQAAGHDVPAGRDVPAAQAGLARLTTEVTAISVTVSQIPGEVLPLTPAGYPGNRATLVAAAGSLAAARQDLVQAAQLAHRIIVDLGGS